jgi:signal peptidase I
VRRTISTGLLADLAGRVLARGAPVTLTVYGHSMRPALENGDRITLAPIGERRPAPGDLVAVGGVHGLVVHRLVGLRSDGTILTAGDAVDHRDRPSSVDALLGVVVEVDRGGRRILPSNGRTALWRVELRRALSALRRRWQELTGRRLRRKEA